MPSTTAAKFPAHRRDLAAAIRSAARRLLEQNGFVNASMDDVAAAVQMSKPTVYSVYPDKKSLLAAAAEEIVAEFDSSLITAFQRHNGTMKEALERLPTALKAMWRGLEQSQVLRLALSERSNLPEMIDFFKHLHWDPSHSAWNEIVVRAMQRKELTRMKPEIAVRMLRAPVINIVVERILFGRDSIDDQTADEYIELSCAGVALAFCPS